MTEELARTKWCPMVRFEGDSGGTFNRGVNAPMNNPEISNTCIPCCITSECMMWRDDTTNTGSSIKEPNGTLTTIRTGYCGLAGKL